MLPQLGDESIGVISAHHYSASLDTPANRKFRAAFEKKNNRIPSFYSENCYTGARVVAEAARAIGGRVEDRAAFMAALRAVEIADAPRGPVKMDPYGNPTQNIYIRRVEKVGGKLQNTVIYTYPSVSQFECPGTNSIVGRCQPGAPEAAAPPALTGSRDAIRAEA